jgi:hypothetical protein
MLPSSWPASRRRRGSYRLPVFEIESPGNRTGALRLWTVLALPLAHRPSALAPQAWLASADVASGIVGSVAAASGVAASVAAVSTAAVSVAAVSTAAGSVAAASAAATPVAVASGVGSSIAVGSGVASSVAMASGGVTTSSLVLMEKISLRLPAEAGVCVGSLEMAAGTGAARAETAMPLTIFLGKAAQWPRLWCE